MSASKTAFILALCFTLGMVACELFPLDPAGNAAPQRPASAASDVRPRD